MKNNNLDLTISSAKPPIFGKKKKYKKQIFIWKPIKIKKLIYDLMELELEIKRNISQSVNLVGDFILNN